MSEVMNVLGNECRGDECRTIVKDYSIDYSIDTFPIFLEPFLKFNKKHVSPKYLSESHTSNLTINNDEQNHPP